MPAPEKKTHSGRASLLLFITLSCFYLMFHGGHIYSPDGVVMYRVTEALMERGEASIEPPPGTQDFGGEWVEDPATGEREFYAWYGLGMSLAAIPTYQLSKALLPLAAPGEIHLFFTPVTAQALGGRSDPRPAIWHDKRSFRLLWYDARQFNFPDAFRIFITSWTNAFVTAGAMVVLLSITAQLGVKLRAGLGMALMVGVATPVLHYAQSFFSEPLAGLFYLIFLDQILRARRGRPLLHLAAAGLSMGIIGLTRVALLVLALPALILILQETRNLPAGARIARLGAAAAGGIPPLVLMLYYNYARFGDPLTTGYGAQVTAWTTPFLEGLAGLLFSPGRGLLLFCPLLVGALFSASAFRRRDPNVHDFSWLSLVALLGLYARWHLWEGGWCWGPRFLLPVVPVVALNLIPWLVAPLEDWRRAALRAFVGVSFVVSMNGQMVNFHDYHQWARRYFEDHKVEYSAQGVEHYYELLRWDWDWSPLRRYWTFPIKETMIFPRALFYPGIVRTSYALFLLGLLGGASALSYLSRRLEDQPE